MMIKMHTTTVHPSRVLDDELEERGLSQAQLARHLHILPKTINEICRGKRGISAEMAMMLSRALGASPGFWLNLQKNWELGRIDATPMRKIERIAA
jgi:addiction module HigA family antidote